jgi:hypothetical protein
MALKKMQDQRKLPAFESRERNSHQRRQVQRMKEMTTGKG